MKSVFCAISAFLLSFTASAYYPIVNNYSKYEYGGSGKIWQIIQTPHGIMHFANDAGILEFDGREWELTPVSNRSSVRSLYYDAEQNRLYFGATNEFGYLDYNCFQKPQYVSLVDQLRSEANEIWGIDKLNDCFFLRENSTVFKVSQNSSQRFDFNNKDDYDFVKATLDWLEKNFDNPSLKIEDMASQSGLSRTSFYNQLKALTGQSPKE